MQRREVAAGALPAIPGAGSKPAGQGTGFKYTHEWDPRGQTRGNMYKSLYSTSTQRAFPHPKGPLGHLNSPFAKEGTELGEFPQQPGSWVQAACFSSAFALNQELAQTTDKHS